MTGWKKLSIKQDEVMLSILALTAFFFLLEISFFIQCNRSYFSDFTFVSSRLEIPLTILPGILYFIIAQVIVHAMFAGLMWLTAVAAINQYRLKHPLYAGICISLFGFVSIITANQYFYPNSKFAELSYFLLRGSRVVSDVLIILVCLWLPLIMAFVIYWVPRMKKALMWVGILLVIFFIDDYRFSPMSNVATEKQPNIIIIGIDSLRPDFLGFFGGQATPFIDHFLNQSVTFSEAVTPLARTFPSWVSVLTGNYPKKTGIRFNLAPQGMVDLSETLPAILQKQGYQTIFATDEARFSNIDTLFGFDRILTPPIGLNDFLLGTFNDFPLSNLVINSWLGKKLFPYSYANRPVYFTYDPDTFVHQLRQLIFQRYQKPLFMAVHFCLPHYPYLYDHLNGNEYSIRERYQASIIRVDKQVQDFYSLLQRGHFLDHAIVVLMSDHGEALELRGDRLTENALFINHENEKPPKFYPPSLDDEEINQSAGHGTDVLGLSQYHSLLAIRQYGRKPLSTKIVTGVVSLLDIKPTILALLHVKSFRTDGQSLMGELSGIGTRERHLFLESDYTPEAIRTVYPETRKAMLEGIDLFQIDPHSTRLTVKPLMAEMIINSKQYADIYRGWMLAFYPENQGKRMPILINLKTGEWTNDLHSKLAMHSPSHEMVKKSQAFFGSEIG